MNANPYTYGGDPLNYVDPNGESVMAAIIVGAVVGVAGGGIGGAIAGGASGGATSGTINYLGNAVTGNGSVDGMGLWTAF